MCRCWSPRSSGCSRLSRPDGSTLDWGARPAPTRPQPPPCVAGTEPTTRSPSRSWSCSASWGGLPRRTRLPGRACCARPVAGGPEPGSAPGDLPGDLDPGPLDLLGAARRPARAPLRFRPAVRQRRRRHRSAAVQGEFPALRGALRAPQPGQRGCPRARRCRRGPSSVPHRGYGYASHAAAPELPAAAPEEVEAFSPATLQEQQILDGYTERFLHGTGPEVAAQLEHLHELTNVDEVMLVVMGHSRAVQSRTVELHGARVRSEEHTSELQSRGHIVWRLLHEKKKKAKKI